MARVLEAYRATVGAVVGGHRVAKVTEAATEVLP